MPEELKEKDMPRWATLLNGEVIAIATKSDGDPPVINPPRIGTQNYEAVRVDSDTRIGMMRGEDGSFAFPNRYQRGDHIASSA